MTTIITIKNKTIILLSAFAFVTLPTFSQSKNKNYIMEKVALDANGTNYQKSVQYYNGLGYPTVSVGVVGGKGETVYSLTTYDGAGREKCKYLPVAISANLGYKTPEEIQNASKSANGGDETAYSQNHYDAIDRVTMVDFPGKTWRDNKKGNEIEYSTNNDNEVICYGVTDDKLTQNSYFPAKKLTKETTKDPDGNKIETYRDFSGKLIMQRVDGSLCTYYVYDELGFLRFVLPPKYQSEKDLAQTCYQYRYDKRGRMITKILPGCKSDSIKYWYDNRDRMICMRDPRLRSAGKYRFFVYDKLDRLVIQGVGTSCSVSATVMNADFSSTSTGLLGTGYVVSSGSFKNAKLEIVNYYDSNQEKLVNTAAVYKYLTGTLLSSTNAKQKGRLTASVSAATNGEFIAQTMYYDTYGNVIVSQTKEIGGRLVSTSNKYTHTNKLKSSSTNIKIYDASSCFTIRETYSYNTKIDQKSSYSITLNNGSNAGASFGYNYNDLGRLSDIVRPVGSIYYTYDMHGWLTSIKTKSFTEKLFYTDGPGTKLYNGNISSIQWQDAMSPDKIRGYKFTYDKANRMTAGIYGEGDELKKVPNLFTEKITYDENGNVKTVNRYKKGTYGNYSVLMDDLTITYNGNQPSSVAETVTDNGSNGLFEYKKGNGTGYKFDKSGSLVADKSRNIAYITYDLNNNPEKIYFINGCTTKYIYSASGQKLRAIYYTANPHTVTRTWGKEPAELTSEQIFQVDSIDYLCGGSLVMRNGRIDKYLFDGGYAQATAVPDTKKDKFKVYTYHKDHLGNNREVVDGSGNVTQVTNYYPFGAPYADATASKGSDVQPYKYNGKELDLMHGLNTYDYGARQYDPILCRMDKIDRFCEKDYSHSPYTYCMGNPARSIDVNGDSCIVLLAPYGARGAGHMAIAIQNKAGEWCLYSKNGTPEHGGFIGKEGKEGTKYHNDRGEKTAKNIQDFFNDKDINPNATENNPNAPANAPEYTEGYLLPTSPEQDQLIRDGVMSYLDRDYSLIASNCAQTVEYGLFNAGLGMPKGLLPKKEVYPSIIKQNPNGKRVVFYNTKTEKFYKYGK